MAKERDKYVDVIAKLVQLTQEGKLTWSSSNPSTTESVAGEQIESIFTTNYKRAKLRILRKRYKHEPNISPAFLGFGSGAGPRWITETVLDMIDDGNFQLWRFPNVGPIDDLFSAVQYQVAGVKSFIENVLQDDEGP